MSEYIKNDIKSNEYISSDNLPASLGSVFILIYEDISVFLVFL